MQALSYVEFFLVSIETVTICDVAACCSFRFVLLIMMFLSGLIALDFLVLLLVVDTQSFVYFYIYYYLFVCTSQLIINSPWLYHLFVFLN
jgi:hypothetical protein